MKRLFLAFIVLVLSLLLAGCQGSSGGVTQLVYTTDWARRATPGQITGRSQRVTLVDSTGAIARSVITNNDADTQISFTQEMPPGEYILTAELFANLNAQGVISGRLDTVVVLNQGQTTTVRTSVGDTIASIGVSPPNANLRVGSGRNFYASGVNSAGVMTFISPNQTTFASLGGVVDVTPTGVATGVSSGSGSIRATYSPLAMNGVATVTVSPTSARKSKWTVMVYLNAANDLNPFARLNVNQMERVAGNPDVRFAVQWKESTSLFSSSLFNGTRRYAITQDTSSDITSTLVQDLGTQIDMGSPDTLRTFINWAKNNYPADRYALIIWNHGNGWRRSPRQEVSRAVSYDDATGNAIQIWELPSALGSNQFDIVSWDASLMQMFEVAYEIKDQAKYVIGSEESPPGEGLPYDTIFARFRDNPDETTANLSKAFVDGMLGVPAYSTRKITQSVVDTSKLADLATAISGLGTELKNNVGSLGPAVTSARLNVKKYSPTGNRFYADIFDLCLKLESQTTIPSVLTAIGNVKTAFNSAIVWEGHNSNSAGSYGLSIDFSPGTTFSLVQQDYLRMRVSAETTWDEWLAVAP